MTDRHVRVYGIAAALLIGASGFALVPHASKDRMAIVPGTQYSSGAAGSSDALRVDTDALVASAPFRASRAAPSVDYQPGSAEPSGPPAALERPPWRLTGVLVGSPTVAVFEGFRDNAPRLLAAGEGVDAYTVAFVSGDSVVVAGRGGPWTFTVEATWR
jgi:hypothetical protein